jgi:recombination protein RecR
MHAPELQNLIQLLAKLPGLGPRSGRRAALHLVKNRHTLLAALSQALEEVGAKMKTCATCGNLDTQDPCHICADPRRDETQLCVVESVSDLWALERASAFRGKYHILGGALSALNGATPDVLSIAYLLDRLRMPGQPIREVILALSATPEGMTTVHYLVDVLKPFPVTVTGIAHGVPVGGELDYLDEGTLSTAFTARRGF